MIGIVFIITLLAFSGGAVLSSQFAVADLPVKMQDLRDNVFATQDDIAYVSMEKVDRIVIYMKDDNSNALSGSDKTPIIDIPELQVASKLLQEANSKKASTAVPAAQPQKPANPPVKTGVISVASGPVGVANSQTSGQIVQAPLAPAQAQAQAAMNIAQKQDLQPIYIQVRPPSDYGLTHLTQNDIKNYLQQEIVNNIINHEYKDSNNVNLAIDFGQLFNQAIAQGLSAEAAMELLAYTNILINNNAGNHGVIVQNSKDVDVVQNKDIIKNEKTNISNSFNQDSFNTDMNNVGNTHINDSYNQNYENVGNDYNISLENAFNTTNNNQYDSSSQDVSQQMVDDYVGGVGANSIAAPQSDLSDVLSPLTANPYQEKEAYSGEADNAVDKTMNATAQANSAATNEFSSTSPTDNGDNSGGGE